MSYSILFHLKKSLWADLTVDPWAFKPGVKNAALWDPPQI